MRISILLLSVLLIISCKTNKKENTEKENTLEDNEIVNTKKVITNKKFANLLSKLETIDLPYKTSCDADYVSNTVLDTADYAFLVENIWDQPFKRIETSHNFEIIMFLVPADIILPVIRTYDLNGKQIDSEQMFFSYCGGEPGYFGKEFIKINKDLSIIHTDSIWSCEVDENYNDIDSTRTLKVKNFSVNILPNGQIEKETNNAP